MASAHSAIPDSSSATYVGRFAPSPTGPLHFGSLIAALASYVDARAAGGTWLLRIEDVDRERSRPEHETTIRRQLDAFAFDPDGDVVRQSDRLDLYRDALRRLSEHDAVYRCVCSRRMLADAKRNQEGEVIYPGTCRMHVPEASGERYAIRFRLPPTGAAVETINDRVAGVVSQNVVDEVGDFVLLRADGDFAYQLAVVVDDELQGVTDVVRGADLLFNTHRQSSLQRQLGYRSLRYAHLPVATNERGEKLSKQTRASPLATDVSNVMFELRRAWAFLGQVAIDEASSPRDFLDQAIRLWSIQAISGATEQNPVKTL